MHQYEMICNEFSIAPTTTWTLRNMGNWGLGRMRKRAPGAGEGHGDSGLADKTWDPNFYVFGHPNYGGKTVRPSINHTGQEGDEPKNGWVQFIPNTSVTLTQPDRVRINQSIRSYCWAMLTAQEAREPMVGRGSTGAAQRRFAELI
jgi:hypothetical protein